MIKFTEKECDCCSESGIPLYELGTEYLCINCARDAIMDNGKYALEFAETVDFEGFINLLSCKMNIDGMSQEDLAKELAESEYDDLLKDYVLEELPVYDDYDGPDEDYLFELSREVDE